MYLYLGPSSCQRSWTLPTFWVKLGPIFVSALSSCECWTKNDYKTRVSSSDHFVLTLGFLWIQSSKPNLAEKEKERKEAMQTDSNKIPERWKNFFKFLETKAYKLPKLSLWHQIFSSVLKTQSVKKYKECKEMQRIVWMYFKTYFMAKIW